VPVIVTLVPPVAVPAFGEIALIVGVLLVDEGELGVGEVGLPGELLSPQLVTASASMAASPAETMFASFPLRRTCTASRSSRRPRGGLPLWRPLRLGRSIICDRRASRISRMPAVDEGGDREAR
jgi:hypothetical protein